MGSVLKNTQRVGSEKHPSAPARLFTRGSFFLAFIFLELCAVSGPVRNLGRGEEKVLIRLYALVGGTEKVRDSPRFWDRSGNLCFSRPLSFRSLYGWLFLSACPQPLIKHTGCVWVLSGQPWKGPGDRKLGI